jgi:hypothetical protein
MRAAAAFVVLASLAMPAWTETIVVSPDPAPLGASLTVRCRADAVPGDGDIVVDWRDAARWPEARRVMKPIAGGWVETVVPTGEAVRADWVICRRAHGFEGQGAQVYLAPAAEIPNLPRFRRRVSSAAATTEEVFASMSFGQANGDLGSPISKPQTLDRKTSAPGVVLFWRARDRDASDDGRQDALRIAAAASDVRAYLGTGPDPETAEIYYIRRDAPPPAERRDFAGVTGRYAIALVEPTLNMVDVVHELVHHFTPDRSRCGLHPGACEGLAVFVQHAYAHSLGALHTTAAATVDGYPHLGFFAVRADYFYSGLFEEHYALAGSLMGFIAQRRGAVAARRIAAGETPEAVLRLDADRLETEWREFLKGFPPAGAMTFAR